MSSILGSGSAGGSGGRIKLTANKSFYITATGSDSNNGSITSPYATIQHAYNVLAQSYDIAAFTVTINCGPGTFAGCDVPSLFGGGFVQFIGSGVASTTIGPAPSASACISAAAISETITFWDQALLDNTISGGANANVQVSALVNLFLGNVFNAAARMNFNTGSNSFAVHIQNYGATVFWGGPANGALFNFTCPDGFNSPFGIFFTEFGGAIIVTSQTTVHGTPNWNDAACRANTSGVVLANSGTFTGAATAFPYTSQSAANIDDNFAGINWFPGTVSPIPSIGVWFTGFTDGTGTYGAAKQNRVVEITDSDYTISGPDSSADAFAIIEMNSAAAHNFTIPTGASLSNPFPSGAAICVVQIGAGAVTVVAAAGVTGINFGAIGGANKSAVIYQRNTDEWRMIPGAFACGH